MFLDFVRLEGKEAVLPKRQTPGSAGYDLYSSQTESVVSGERKLISIGFSVKIPESHYGRIAPRSGLSVKKSIDIGAGVIDSDYRGLVKILIINNGQETFHIKQGDRIAQLIVEKISTLPAREVDSIDVTERGYGGFGSTGN